jgi:hypothetical protein
VSDSALIAVLIGIAAMALLAVHDWQQAHTRIQPDHDENEGTP